MEAIETTMVDCQLCGLKSASLSTENDPNSKLKYKFSFCRECFSTGTLIVGFWRYIRLHPDYRHPVIDFTREDSFNDIKEKYLKNRMNLANWKIDKIDN